MKKHRNTENSNSLKRFDDLSSSDNTPSRLSSLIFILLAVILTFATLAFGAVDTWALAILSTGIGFITVLWLTDSFLNNEFRFNSNPLQFPLIGIILIGFIQLLPFRDLGISKELLPVSPTNSISLDPFTTHLAIINYCVYLIFFAASLTYINTQKRVKNIVFFIILFGSMMSFFGIIQSFSKINSIYGLRFPTNISYASFINRHHFAAFMEMTIGLSLGLLFGKSTKKDKRLLLIISIILMGSSLLLTGSRGALISLFGVIGFVTLLNFKNKESESDENQETLKSSNKIFLFISSLMLILALIGMVLFIGGDGYISRSFGLTEQDDISTGRTHFWYVALQIIRDNPIIGTGLDAFGTAFTKYDTWNGNSRVEQAHNDYLQMLADAGILGFTCVIAFIFFLFKQGFRLIKKNEDRFQRGVIVGALAGCLGILIHSFFDFPLRTPSNALFFLILAILATSWGQIKHS